MTSKAYAEQSGGRPIVSTLIMVAIALFVGYGILGRLRGGGSALAGKLAPDFSVQIAADSSSPDRVRLADLRDKTVLLAFWAISCPACQSELPELEKVARQFKDKSVVVLAINAGEDRESVHQFAGQRHFSFSVGYDDDGEITSRFGVDALPTLFVINRQGQVTAVEHGVTGERKLSSLISAAN